MTTLHTINCTPSNRDCWQDCLNAISDGDTLLMIENGVYGAMSKADFWPDNVQIAALEGDLKARGLSAPASVETISMQAFVELSVQHSKVVSWF